jgi:uncharacterized membrane protein YidH (DUF202 family)
VSGASGDRPTEHFDAGLQHERTALAWERTAVATMVAGTILARYAAIDAHPVLALIGLLQLAFGGALLVWTGFHYDQLHGPLRASDPVVHPTATRLVGIGTVGFTGAALALAAIVTLSP